LYPLNRQNIVLANERWKRAKEDDDFLDDIFILEEKNYIGKYSIRKPAVVVSLINAPYSMCLPAKSIVDIPKQTLIFTPKPGFDAEFITLLFRQLDWVAEQFEACALEITKGEKTEKYITVDDLLDFKLPIPPLEEQQKIVLEYKSRQVDQLILDIKLKEAYEQTRAIEYEVIASISHSLKNKLGIINNDLETLINILETKEAQQILNLQEPIRPYFDTEDPATTHIDTAAQIIDRLRNGFAEASDIFKTAEKMQYRKLNFQTVNLNEYFEQIKYKFAVPNQNIEVKGNTPNLVLKIDTDAMNEVIENLIINARKHGFINKEQLYHLVFELSQVNRNGIEYAQITYQNDGKAMPKDFSFADFIRFSEKAGKTQGEGIGGYTINKIVQLHGGIFEEAKPSVPSFKVAFNILLPIQSSSK
jgi:K+-sensing histidine kinase KdpD